jgi:hypothetical protein
MPTLGFREILTILLVIVVLVIGARMFRRG